MSKTNPNETILNTVRDLKAQASQAGKDAIDAGDSNAMNKAVRAVKVLDNTVKQLDRIFNGPAKLEGETGDKAKGAGK